MLFRLQSTDRTGSNRSIPLFSTSTERQRSAVTCLVSVPMPLQDVLLAAAVAASGHSKGQEGSGGGGSKQDDPVMWLIADCLFVQQLQIAESESSFMLHSQAYEEGTVHCTPCRLNWVGSLAGGPPLVTDELLLMRHAMRRGPH